MDRGVGELDRCGIIHVGYVAWFHGVLLRDGELIANILRVRVRACVRAWCTCRPTCARVRVCVRVCARACVLACVRACVRA